jgi:hypothetical protein
MRAKSEEIQVDQSDLCLQHLLAVQPYTRVRRLPLTKGTKAQDHPSIIHHIP